MPVAEVTLEEENIEELREKGSTVCITAHGEEVWINATKEVEEGI